MSVILNFWINQENFIKSNNRKWKNKSNLKCFPTVFLWAFYNKKSWKCFSNFLLNIKEGISNNIQFLGRVVSNYAFLWCVFRLNFQIWKFLCWWFFQDCFLLVFLLFSCFSVIVHFESLWFDDLCWLCCLWFTLFFLVLWINSRGK